MQIVSQKIAPCLWFDTQAEEAAKFYVSIFKDSKITTIARYPDEGREIHGKEAGSVMTVAFELAGQSFVALNGGPHFKFDEAISFQVYCDSQAEVDHFWSKLSAGGVEGPCGWLKDEIRPLLAGGAGGSARNDDGSRRQEIGAGDEGFHADEEIRHRDAQARLRRRSRLKRFPHI